MDELVDLNDISTASFQSPISMQPTSKLGQLGSLEDTPLLEATNLTPEKYDDKQEDECKDLESTLAISSPETPIISHFDSKDMNKKSDIPTTETPNSRQRKIRVNIEVERIMVNIQCTFSNIG